MSEIVYFGLAFFTTAIGITAFRRFAPRSRFIDLPNDRSLHNEPTLRGGGVVIVVVCLVLYLVLSSTINVPVLWAYLAGAVVVAGVSFLDDLYSLPVPVRFAAHTAAAAILVFSAWDPQTIYFPIAEITVEAGLAAKLIGVLWIVWMVNAYNFMDGIDGIAGAQAVVAGLCWAAFGYNFSTPVYYLFGGVLAFSSLGFLLHNWRPASVFMGDVGSAFFGFTFAAMPFIGDNSGSRAASYLPIASLAFLWMFVADSVVTLIRRAVRGEKVWRAHREHIYQRIVISGAGHDKVTLLYAGAALIIGALFFAAITENAIAEWGLLAAAAALPALFAVAAERKNV